MDQTNLDGVMPDFSAWPKKFVSDSPEPLGDVLEVVNARHVSKALHVAYTHTHRVISQQQLAAVHMADTGDTGDTAHSERVCVVQLLRRHGREHVAHSQLPVRLMPAVHQPLDGLHPLGLAHLGAARAVIRLAEDVDDLAQDDGDGHAEDEAPAIHICLYISSGQAPREPTAELFFRVTGVYACFNDNRTEIEK